MEVYSTALWHLHAEVQLSTLAQDLVSQDRNTAAAWCATGNLFSAQTEHETAIKFFQRAIQVLVSIIIWRSIDDCIICTCCVINISTIL